MKTGEIVHDSNDTEWTIGQRLWVDVCSATFVARSSSGDEGLCNVALQAGDFASAESQQLADICATINLERAASEFTGPRTPTIARGKTVAGVPFFIVPRPQSTVGQRLRGGAPLGSIVSALHATAVNLAKSPHGDLNPDNILIEEDGSVRLMPPCTPSLARFRSYLTDHNRQSTRSYLPPESADEPSQSWDTYALCLCLYEAASLPPTSTDGRRGEPAELPTSGLDKVSLTSVKDQAQARLQQERSNPRFVERFSSKLGAVLNRGLSAQRAPSPPYRFLSTKELAGRLEEIQTLISPTVVEVGRVILSSEARDEVFSGGATAAFSTTVTVTAGVDQDDLATGLLVRDLDAEGDDRVAVPEAQYTVKPHPSGRLRFDYTLPHLRPGRYTVRVAFTIKDSGDDPKTSDGAFELRPPPGYIPPVDEPAAPPPLEFPQDPAEDDQLDEPFATDAGFDASPIAPSDPGTAPFLPDADGNPPPELQSSIPMTPVATRPLPSPETPSGSPSANPASDAKPNQTLVPEPSVSEQAESAPADTDSQWGPKGGDWSPLPELDTRTEVPASPRPADSAEPPSLTDDGFGLLPSPEGLEDLPGYGDESASTIDQVLQLARANITAVIVVAVALSLTSLICLGLFFF